MPIYVKIPGITGTVKEANHKGWISVDSCDVEVVREVSEGTGAAKNRETRAPVVGVYNFAKKVDDSSGGLAKWSIGEPSKGIVEIHFLKTGEAGFDAYLSIKLAQCILSKYECSADDSAEEKGSENFSISYLSIETKFQQYGEDGKAEGGPDITAYNLRNGKAEWVAIG